MSSEIGPFHHPAGSRPLLGGELASGFLCGGDVGRIAWSMPVTCPDCLRLLAEREAELEPPTAEKLGALVDAFEAAVTERERFSVLAGGNLPADAPARTKRAAAVVRARAALLGAASPRMVLRGALPVAEPGEALLLSPEEIGPFHLPKSPTGGGFLCGGDVGRLAFSTLVTCPRCIELSGEAAPEALALSTPRAEPSAGTFVTRLVIENPDADPAGFFLYGWCGCLGWEGVDFEEVAELPQAGVHEPGFFVVLRHRARLELILHARRLWRPGDGWVRTGGLVEALQVNPASPLMLTSLLQERGTDTPERCVGAPVEFCTVPMRLEVFARFCYAGGAGEVWP